MGRERERRGERERKTDRERETESNMLGSSKKDF